MTNRGIIGRKLKTRLGFKECITERDFIGILQERIRLVVRINVEEDRHVHLFTRVQSLLLKTETLNLIEVRPGLEGDNVVGGNPINWPETFQH